MDSTTQVGLLTIGTGAVSSGVTTISTNLVTGLVLVAVGIAIFIAREYLKID